MYNVPITYPYPYYVNPSIYNSNLMLRNSQGKDRLVFEAILDGIKGEASAIDLYSRLVNLAPNQKHKNDILNILEDEKVHWQQHTNLYISMTGRQPVYQIEKVSFRNYREGLQKAYETELELINSCVLNKVKGLFKWGIVKII